MPFFEPLPPRVDHQPVPSAPVPPWVRPPAEEIPHPVPAAQVLAKVEGAAIILRRIDVYRDGIAFVLRVLVALDENQPVPKARPGQGPDHLRLGVTLADGTTATTPYGFVPHSDAPPVRSLVFSGGGGGRSTNQWMTELEVWLWPLPPSGPLTLHFESELLGIPEGSTVVELPSLEKLAASVIDAAVS